MKKRPKTCKKILMGKCTEPSCDLWHPPECLNYKSESGCKYGDCCQFRHTEVDSQPRKKSQTSGGIIYSVRLCIPRLPSEKVYSAGG